ncbi:16S rRNA (adenine(1518)-N(6)/adenine(1519)-N(6))-dimethyltransferase, partial [Francisella tularensis subsp. holarctica]|uniref:rRNA adenine N-6-methyltransferase family protein n=1 Tax=Francisella tularensis TaxID=263 RepID=UPI002381B904
NFQKYVTTHIYNQDYLKFDISSIEISSNQKIKLIGNLPYIISSPILFKVIKDRDNIVVAHFMLQTEGVERIVSLPT